MKGFLKDNFWGIFLSAALGVAAYFLAPLVPYINGIILAFLLAVVIGNIWPLGQRFKKGITFSSATLLEFAIIFLAFSISFQSIAILGWQKFLFVLIIVIISLVATLLIAKRINREDSTSWLVGFGTAICGSSAIAALAPIISKNKEDAGIAIAVVNLLGSIGMVLLPFTLKAIFEDAGNVGFIIGATLQSVGNVAGAGYGLSQEIGDSALTVKLARVALLTPAVVFFSFMANRSQKSTKKQFISFKLPYYLWLFILITIVNSVLVIPGEILDVLKSVGKIFLTISMAAIGLKVSFKTLWESGKMAVGFGTIIFLIQIIAAIGLILAF
ncbi:putative sulfate exporter family transporter [Chitinophagales bacterium]|nr:putative sulfate exporter family transporter [Chitinophagales bacterium]